MHADKLLPGRGRLPLRSRRKAMALENVAHGLVTDGVPEVGQSADDPVVAPGTILPRQAQHQRLQLQVERRAPWYPALLGAVEFLRDECAVPGENRVGLDNSSYFLQGL